MEVTRMPVQNPPVFLLASADPALLTAIEPAFFAVGVRVEVVLSAEAALSAMTGPKPPDLALLDANLPGMEIARLLAAAQPERGSRRFPIEIGRAHD